MVETDPLVDFESTSRDPTDVRALVSSISRSFQLIERWTGARSNEARIEGILQSIKSEVLLFYKSIDQSVKTAEAGFMFADEAENFCDTLLNAEDCSVEDLEECINDLRDLSQRALVETGEMSRMFKSNRQNFFDITMFIGSMAVERLKTEQQMHDKERAKADRHAKRYEAATIGGVALNATFAASVMAIGVAAAPPALIMLTTALPASVLVAAVMSSQKRSMVEARATVSKECAVAIEELRRACEFLEDLSKHLDAMTKYWEGIEAMLLCLRNRCQRLRACKVNEPKVKHIKSGWGRMKGQYLEYKCQLSRLQDLYPASKGLPGSESSEPPAGKTE